MAGEVRVNAAGRHFWQPERWLRSPPRRHDQTMRRLSLLVALVAGCSPLSYTFTPAGRGVVSKPKGCTFEVRTSEPTEGFEEIGTLAHYNGESPKDVEQFKAAVADQVCEVGGDAVITLPNDKGRLTKGMVIKWTHYAEPVAPLPK